PGVDDDREELFPLGAGAVPEGWSQAVATRAHEEPVMVLRIAGLAHQLLRAPRVIGVLGDRAVDLRVVCRLRRNERVRDGRLALEDAFVDRLFVDGVREGAARAGIEKRGRLLVFGPMLWHGGRGRGGKEEILPLALSGV